MKAEIGPKYKVNNGYFNWTNWGVDSHGSMGGGMGYVYEAQHSNKSAKALWQRLNYGMENLYFLVEGMREGDILGVGGGTFDKIQCKFYNDGIIHIDKIDGICGFVVWNDANPGPRYVRIKNITI